MYNRILSAALIGMDVVPVRVEADVSDGLPQFTMVGYLTSQVREAEDRVRTSFRNAGFALPPKHITVNMLFYEVRSLHHSVTCTKPLSLLNCFVFSGKMLFKNLSLVSFYYTDIFCSACFCGVNPCNCIFHDEAFLRRKAQQFGSF